MAKKKSHRKTNFSYSQPLKQEAGVVAPTSGSKQISSQKVGSNEVVDLDIVRADLKTVLKLAIGFILLEMVLWYLLQHTGLGSGLYSHLK